MYLGMTLFSTLKDHQKFSTYYPNVSCRLSIKGKKNSVHWGTAMITEDEFSFICESKES